MHGALCVTKLPHFSLARAKVAALPPTRFRLRFAGASWRRFLIWPLIFHLPSICARYETNFQRQSALIVVRTADLPVPEIASPFSRAWSDLTRESGMGCFPICAWPRQCHGIAGDFTGTWLRLTKLVFVIPARCTTRRAKPCNRKLHCRCRRGLPAPLAAGDVDKFSFFQMVGMGKTKVPAGGIVAVGAVL